MSVYLYSVFVHFFEMSRTKSLVWFPTKSRVATKRHSNEWRTQSLFSKFRELRDSTCRCSYQERCHLLL